MVGESGSPSCWPLRRAGRGDHPQPGARGAGGRRRGQHHRHRLPPGRARRPADRLDAADPDRPTPICCHRTTTARTRGVRAARRCSPPSVRSPWSWCWRWARRSACARATSSAPTSPPAESRSTRACRGSCSAASSSTTSCRVTSITYASLDPQTRKDLFDHRLRSDSDARGRDQADRGGLAREIAPAPASCGTCCWVAVLTGIGFLAVYTARQQEISSTSLIYARVLLRALRDRAHRPAGRTAGRRPLAAAAGGAPVRRSA